MAGGFTLWRTLQGHGAAVVQQVTWSPDGDRLASGGSDHSVRVWDGLPSELVFLKELNYLRFGSDVHEEEVLDNLEWGITGSHPRRGW